ncbi:transcriptional coactivator p15/PC4 family protein [Bradyrhizobium sp. 26S5]|uniref:transcriptional coactivator p15/PC4 family protein n=1 Tax=Bradyrhizobium sp. 26S5 TaxID=3139729 RepID=UPI0030D292E3
MTSQPSPHAPSDVVAEWPKGPNELVRVSLGKYHGHTIVNIRVWYQSSGETFRPSKNGVSLGLAKHALKIRKALKKAEEIARVEEGGRE